MTDLRNTIIAKSDQLNSDDLIGAPRIITVTDVKLMGEADQPIAVHYEGDGGKPWKPCKSMRRVLVNIWGHDGGKFRGRRVELYRDPNVKWGGQAVGGIRISRASHIERDVTMALTETRANRKPFTVKPLIEPKAASETPSIDLLAWADTITARLPDYTTVAAMKADWDVHKVALKDAHPDRFTVLNKAVIARAGELSVEE